MVNSAKLIVVFLIIMALLIGCTASPAAAPVKPVAQEQKPPHIMIVYNSDISGPYAPIAGPGVAAWTDAAAYINDELGGLYGVPWKITLMDTQGKVDACVANLPKILDMKPKPLGLSLSVSAECEAMLALTREAQLPTMTAQTIGSLYPVGYQFSIYALYPDTFGYFCDWLVKNWKGTEKPKVAFLNWDTSFGRGFVTDETSAYAKQKGVDIVANEFFAVTDIDCSTQLLRIQNAKADWIFSGTMVSGSFAVASSANKLGLNIPIIFPMSGSYDGPIIRMNPKAAEGTYFVGGGWPVTDYTQPGIKKAREYWDKAGRPDKSWCTAIILNGWNVHMKFYEAAKRVVDKYGWQNLDGKHVKEALETFNNEKIFFGTQVITYTPDKHSQNLAFIGQVKDGVQVSLENTWNPMPDLRPAKFKSQ